MSFRLVPKSVTLNDLERRNGRIFLGIWYLGQPLTFAENFTEIVAGEPLCRGS